MPETCRDRQYKAKNNCDSQERSTDHCFPSEAEGNGPEFKYEGLRQRSRWTQQLKLNSLYSLSTHRREF